MNFVRFEERRLRAAKVGNAAHFRIIAFRCARGTGEDHLMADRFASKPGPPGRSHGECEHSPEVAEQLRWPDGINFLSSLSPELNVQRRANADYDASAETCEVFPGEKLRFSRDEGPSKTAIEARIYRARCSSAHKHIICRVPNCTICAR